MALLRGSPYYLTQAMEMVIKVQARNQIGWSPLSAESSITALVQDLPHQPLQSPKRDDILTSDLLLQVTWASFNDPENGGATILSYHL
jgi:hypothetical protein